MVTIENCEKLFHKQKNTKQIERHIYNALVAAGILDSLAGELILRAERVSSSKIRPLNDIRRVSPRGGIDKFTVEIPRVCHKIPAIVCSVAGDPQELEKIFFGPKKSLADSMEKVRHQPNTSNQKEVFNFQNQTEDAIMAKSTFKIAELIEEKALFYIALLDYQGIGIVTTVQLKKILTDLSVMDGSGDAEDQAKYRAAIRCWVNPVGFKHSTNPKEGNIYTFEWDKIEAEIDALGNETKKSPPKPEKTLEQMEEDFGQEMYQNHEPEAKKLGEVICLSYFEEEYPQLPTESDQMPEKLPEGHWRNDTQEEGEEIPQTVEATEEKKDNSSVNSWFEEITQLVEREKFFLENGEATRIKNSISVLSREISDLEEKLGVLQTKRYELQMEYNALPEPLSQAEQVQLEKLRKILALQ